jgi:hypothetical protein
VGCGPVEIGRVGEESGGQDWDLLNLFRSLAIRSDWG